MSVGNRLSVTALKTIHFLLLLPGTLLVLLSWTLIRAEAPLFSYDVLHWLAVPCWILGAASFLWCARAFSVRGHGTPSPIDPPGVTVVSGLYCWNRNSICAGVVVLLLAGFTLTGFFLHGQLRLPAAQTRARTFLAWSAANTLALVMPLAIFLLFQ